MDDIPCTYRVSVKAIIKDENGNVLLLQEADGLWDLPGGGLEQGELARDAIVREVLEETGCAVLSVSQKPTTFWTVRRSGSSAISWFAFIAYEVTVSGAYAPAEDTNDAAVAAKYVSVSEATALTLHPNAYGYFEQLSS